jgi:hypothetical protein
MRQIVIGDIHGRTDWKRILQRSFDRVIFLGDYLDTHESITPMEQLNNFREILKFRELNDNVILLIGNHDYHYFPGIEERYSGYQPTMRKSFEYELSEYKSLMQMCFVDEYENVFSHAGLTETWLNDVGISAPSIYSVVDQVNELFQHKPYKFSFYHDDTSFCGDNIHQSCIWVRPNSLWKDGINYNQIVGHTTQYSINPRKSGRQGYWLIDTLGTSGEYLVIEDGEITIQKSSKKKTPNPNENTPMCGIMNRKELDNIVHEVAAVILNTPQPYSDNPRAAYMSLLEERLQRYITDYLNIRGLSEPREQETP